jgi:hypothetical protein
MYLPNAEMYKGFMNINSLPEPVTNITSNNYSSTPHADLLQPLIQYHQYYGNAAEF